MNRLKPSEITAIESVIRLEPSLLCGNERETKKMNTAMNQL